MASNPIPDQIGASDGNLEPSSKPDPIPLVIKWLGKEIHIENVMEFKTVGELKQNIHEKTGVQVSRQKLLNLQYKGKLESPNLITWCSMISLFLFLMFTDLIVGKPAADSLLITDLKPKPGFKIMMMGSLEKDIEKVDVPPEDRPEIVNDLDFNTSDKITLVESNDVYLSKVNKRVQEYKITELNPLRQGKKLLVLDIDYTLFDHRSAAETGLELMRPGLHEFLRDAYKVRGLPNIY
jgi:ubiquitin-like domain-containing CTD phosphatase 1